MKSLQTFVQLALAAALLFALTMPAYPHGGGLDAYGCHHNRKQGDYHCHRGPLKGQSFASQEEVLKKLSTDRPDTTKKSTPAKQ